MSKLTLYKDETGTIVKAAIDGNTIPGFASVTTGLTRDKMDATIKASFDEVAIATYVPDPVPAPTLTAVFSAGTAAGTTKAVISDVDASGNRFAYSVASTAFVKPNVGTVVTSTTVYNSGDNITGVDATTNKYVALYELTATNAVVKFVQHELSTSEIAV